MREVLFRGKEVADGKWIEGFYSAEEYNPYSGEVEHIPRIQIIGKCVSLGVIPETVGQYTGLTDKNGVKIFEGDILDVSSDVAYGGVAVHRLGYFVVEFHNGCFMKSALDDPQLSFFDNAKRKGLYHFISTDIHKIVGNIHDNPDILKGGGENG